MRKFFDFLMPNKPKAASTAAIAKERLQIIVSHESAATDDPDFIRKLQDEMLEVICKYINIDRNQIRVQLEQRGEHSVLELNVTLEEAEVSAQAKAHAAQASKADTTPKAQAPAKESTTPVN